ncbi:adenine nucleotide alpha hydrolases-like protein [Trichodelitschia bisporula]|uniref:Diphthine--ammonia ligase n=1 Tax=Trichodelitschia bisporula TaxID=703511 RepID=A0A6G1IB46_9PEZI|nr:adenine nucleotide alpha hydrolases-like protein [Trichodelitschia bisporula]
MTPPTDLKSEPTMDSRPQVLCLISGGKDSLYSLAHCERNGYVPVALGNLHPLLPDTEDVDSFMYQTIGHAVVPLYSKLLGLPLYRRAITGGVVVNGREYAPAETADAHDEAEDLMALVRDVLVDFPNLRAVSSGAILSTYQRTRIESVTQRLGLVSLAWLWHYPALPPHFPSSLLDDMGKAGMDVRIVKLASGGLQERFLWNDITQTEVWYSMEVNMQKFMTESGLTGGVRGGGSALGEGGEFETLVIKGLGGWKGRIEVESYETVVGEGGCSAVKILGAKAVKFKNEEKKKHIRIPDLLDEEFGSVMSEMIAGQQGLKEKKAGKEDDEILDTDFEPLHHIFTDSLPSRDGISYSLTTSAGNILQIANLRSIKDAAADQLVAILAALRPLLTFHSLTPESIVSTTLLLRHIADFTTINSIYSTLFPRPNPPSRTTIALGSTMPKGVHVMLSLVLRPLTVSRRTLHVQSRSYWAPANIGPYSQAVAVSQAPSLQSFSALDAELVYLAGQIPLLPASMSPPTEPPSAVDPKTEQRIWLPPYHALLALQHVWRIGRAMDVAWWAGGVAYIAPSGTGASPQDWVRVVQEAWRRAHVSNDLTWLDSSESSDDEDFDVWHNLGKPSASTSRPLINDVRPRLPRLNDVKFEDGAQRVPPLFVVRVAGLPRDVGVEWGCLGIRGEIRVRSAVDMQRSDVGEGWVGYFEITNEKLMEALQGEGEGIDWTVYVGPKVGIKVIEWARRVGAVVVPCEGVWGEKREIEAGAIGRKW